jgi:hydrogenase large subunit
MTQRLVIDPITRIEGHLRIEAQMEGEHIKAAYSAGTMVRGLEIILRDRDPRDAWALAQRICGVCTLVHGIASVRSVEDALKYPIPKNAQLIRNLMIAAQYVHDHVMHFYHLHALDWVDVVSALSADPDATAELAQTLSPWPKASRGYFRDTQARIKAFVEQGQLGIFANGYWGHPGYALPPEVNLLAVAHYLEALAWQREVVQIHTIFGGKNPHPNFLVGGVALPVGLDHDSAFNAERLGQVRDVITRMKTFVDQVYVPDTLAIAGFYPDWFAQGEGVGNFLTYGEFPGGATDDVSKFMIPRGVILDRDLSRIHPVDLNNDAEIQEFAGHSWYRYGGKRRPKQGLHPYAGETVLDYDGPQPPYEQLDVDQGYSWLKAPRWKGKPVEVGPLARVLMLYATGHGPTKELVDGALAKLKQPLPALYSTMGRTAARTLETKLIVDAMAGWLDALVANIKSGDTATHNPAKWEPGSWPSKAKGVGFMEAPRGALGHWIVIEHGRIANYQAVVPSTWNAGPRDPAGQTGPYEAALAGHSLAKPDQPLEVLRTIHSFDPCIACAVHVTDLEGGEVVKVQVR